MGIVDFLKGAFEGTVGAIEDVIDGFGDLLNGIISLFTSLSVLTNPTKLNKTLSNPVELLIGTASNYASSPGYKIYTAFIPAGIILLMIFFAFRISDLLMTDQYDAEQLLKTIAYLIISLLIMDNGYLFMLKCYDAICGKGGLGTEVIKTLQKTYTSNGLFSGATLEQILGSSFSGITIATLAEKIIEMFQALNNLILLFVPIIFALILIFLLSFQVDYIAIKRAIKIFVCMCFAPLAFADLFGDALTRTQAFNHFKKIISLFLQGPIILITMSITGKLVNSSLPPLFPFMLKMFFLYVMIKKALKASEETADSIVGI